MRNKMFSLLLALLVAAGSDFGQGIQGGGSTSGGSGGGLTYCAPASASGTTYACTPGTALTSYAAGGALAFVPDVVATGGATTINVSGLGAKSIKESDGTTNPNSVDLPAGQLAYLTYDGTVYRIGPGTAQDPFSDGTCTTSKTINPALGYSPSAGRSWHTMTLTASTNCAVTFTLPSAGRMMISIEVTNAAGAAGTLTWANAKWPSNTVYTMGDASGASAESTITCSLSSTEAKCSVGGNFQ